MKRKMEKSICALMVLFLSTAHTFAADGITATSLTVPQGGAASLEIVLNNPDGSYGGFQFELKLPTGISATEIVKADRLTAIDGYTLQMNLSDAGSNVYSILGYNTDRISITGTSGAVAYITLSASADLSVETVFNCKLENVTLSSVDLDQTDALDAEFTITIGEPYDGRTVLDETSTTAPVAASGVDVRVIRTINANEWSTICLPFAMTSEQVTDAFGADVELGDAESYETTEDDDDNIVNINIIFSTVEAIEANHPYIIKVSSAITSFDVDGVDVIAATSVSGRRKRIGSGSYFIGNYENQAEVPEFALFLNGNKFWYSKGNTVMKGFRAYFSLRDVLTVVDEAAARISFNFNNATGIAYNERMRNGEEERMYDLQGRLVGSSKLKVQDSKLKKGIYLKEGRKVVVK